MHPVVKAQMLKFKDTNPIAGLGDDAYFELYTIFSLLNGRRNDNIDPFKVHLEGTEFGIDGCAITIQGTLAIDSDSATEAMMDYRDGRITFTFLQAKRSESYDYGDMSKFFDAVYGFFSGDMEGESDQLDDLIGAKDVIFSSALRKNPELICFFASTGKYEPVDRIEKLKAATISRLEDLSLFDRIDIEIVGAKELQGAYRGATSANLKEIAFSQNKTMPGHPKVDQAFIGFIDAKELLSLATNTPDDDGDVTVNQSVFFDNIRDFDPNSSINQKIVSELKEGDRQGFVFRNNGVTVVAKHINRTGDNFRVEDYQIVNGCQTSNILFEARDHIDGVSVPLRLIGSSNDEFITSIIIGTNSQNQVKDEQFWALKPFMKDLEEYFFQQQDDLKLYLERRENQYRNESVERTRIVKPSDLMKAVAAMYLFQPHRAARDFRGIRAEFSNKLFIEGHSVIAYHAAAYASYRFDYLVRNKRLSRKANIHKFYVLSAMGRRETGSVDIFELKSNKAYAICDTILRLCSDEADMIQFCQGISERVDALLESRLGAAVESSAREKIRDALRSETFATDFEKVVRAQTS